MLNAVAIAGPGQRIKTAASTSSCQTDVRNSTPASSIAPKPAKNSTEALTARPKLRTRSIEGSTIGAAWRSERHQIAGSKSTVTASSAITEAELQLHSWPLTIATTSAPIATISASAPSTSGRAAFCSRRSASVRMPKPSPSSPTGMLTRKTRRQSACTSSPPSGGPGAVRDVALVRADLGQHQPERRRQHQRAAGRLDDPRDDEEVDGRRERARGARGDEDAEAEQERALAPERVG